MRRYRLLLRLFPRAWRERYGDEVLRLLSEEKAKGTSGLRPSLDLVHSGLVERLRQFQHLVWSGVRFSRGRAIALGAGLLVAAVGFSMLTASVEVGTAQIQGVVGSNWRGAYDLLVLPGGGSNSSAQPGHAVQANYLSAATDGITMSQYQRIAGLPGVAIAAPLEIVGYVLETVSVPVALTSVTSGTGAEVFTFTSAFTADNGLSKYPSQVDSYAYVTSDPLTGLQINQARQIVGQVEKLPDGDSVTVCPSEIGGTPAQPSPFEAAPDVLDGSCASRSAGAPIYGYVTWSFPVLLAAVDPAAESELTGLDKTVTSGHYLGETAGPTSHDNHTVVPILASTASFDSDLDHVTVGLLPASAVATAQSQDPASIAVDFKAAKPATVMQTTLTAGDAWQALLRQLAATALMQAGNQSSPVLEPLGQIVGQYWTAGPVSYHEGPAGQPTVTAVANPDSIWTTGGAKVSGRNYVFAPPAAADTGFRQLTEHLALPDEGTFSLLEVGEFNPYRLPGFAGDASPLATYRAPLLTGADPASQAALGGQPLEPDGNMAGYTQEPPLLLTTLGGARPFQNPANFSGVSSAVAAPIGSIRVRAADLFGSVPEQLGKIAAIGQEIRQQTGLRVVVTAGASPQAVTIGLPAGKFGRPALQVSEDWTAVMVAMVILRQADKESVALFVLILVVCGLFLAGAALASVHGRRAETAVLRALGWGRRQVFALVLGEVAFLGMAAGVVGTALSLLLIDGLRLDVPPWRAALVLPVAVGLAVLSGLVPAALAARTEPVRAFRSATRSPRRRTRPVSSIMGMALTGIARTPGRCALAAGALAAGVAGLAVLLAVDVSFTHSIGDSVLAGLVSASTRGTDLASALLAVGLGAASVADVTYLNLRERAAELAALVATGWGRADLSRLLLTEALVVAVFGSALGALVGLIGASYAFGLSSLVGLGVVGAMATGSAAALLGTAAVLVFTGATSVTFALAADE